MSPAVSIAEYRAARDAEDQERFAKCIRRVDMAAELAKPRPIEDFVVNRFVKAGVLTLMAGVAGSGKSFFGMEMAAAVKAGRPAGGAPHGMRTGRPRPAVYVDAEMGTALMTERFRACGLSPDAFDYLDVSGLDLGRAAGAEALEAQLREIGVRGGIVVMDSLRRLAPGKRENDSDDMAPYVGSLGTMARDLGCGILLLHHSGKGGEGGGSFLRGSSAIGDQGDATFGFVVDGDSRYLSHDINRGGKYRFGPEPGDRYFRLAVGEAPGPIVVAAASGPAAPLSARERRAQDIRALLEEQPLKRAEIGPLLDLDADNKSVRDALSDLMKSGAAFRDEATNLWQLKPVAGGVVVEAEPRESEHHHPPEKDPSTGAAT